jgi:hypothetical protein
MFVEVSVGELLDKVSILELKLERISNPDKQSEIRRELAALSGATALKETFALWYHVLCRINKHIWDLTDTLKARTAVDQEYAVNAHQIMDFNQRRFRVKNILNLSDTTSLKEQKGYPQTSVVLDDDDPLTILYAGTVYDTVYLRRPSDVFSAPPFYTAEPDAVSTRVTIPADEASLYALPPLRYVSGGMIGDFLHQLSVVYETYLRTGRKGVLYIADMGGPFRRGLPATYSDLRGVIEAQSYIAEFSIYRNEPVDINLSAWRNHPSLYQSSWAQIFADTYGVPWGAHPWIRVPPAVAYNDITFLSVTSNRPCEQLDFTYILSKVPGTPVFLATEEGQEAYFLERFKIPSIPVLRVTTFRDLATAIAACRLFIGTLSMPLALADALGVKRIALLPNSDDRAIAARTPKPSIFTMEDAYSVL